jgi:uncharacterized FlaG/YvyC family protein
VTSLTATGVFHQSALAPPAASPGEPASRGKPASGEGKGLPAGDDRAALEPVVRELERRIRAIGRALRFEVNLDGGPAVIQVLDRETGEVIRRIPREKLSLFMAANRTFDLRLFDERV